MPGRKLNGAEAPTPGPWLVRGEAEPGASARDSAPGDCPLHLAAGIQRLADARLMAAAPDLAAVLLQLLVSPRVRAHDPDSATEAARTAAWNLLVRVAPHLSI